MDARPRYFRDATDRASGLELFFDLVFVLCVSQLADVLREDPVWPTAGSVLLVFVPVWWAWVGVTFALDRFPADDALSRLLVLAAAAGAGLMALAIPSIATSGAVFFAVGYATIRVVLVVLYARAVPVAPAGGRHPRAYAIGFAAVAALWVLSIPLPPLPRAVVWSAAMVIDVLVPVVTDRVSGLLPVDRAHLPERFGSFVIIVLGETTTSTAAVVAGRPLDAVVVLVLAEDFLVGALLWWGFFDRGAWRRRYRALQGDRSGRLANVICAYLHFPLVAGVIAVAAGLQLVVRDPGGRIGDPAATCLAGGIVLYLLTLNVMTWVLRIPPAGSLTGARLVLIAVLVGLRVLGDGWPGPVFVGGCILVLLAHLVLNLVRPMPPGGSEDD